MATGNNHFKSTGLKSPSSSGEVPWELMALAGGGLVLFLLVTYLFWKRATKDAPPEG